MTDALRQPSPLSIFRPEEPVIQSHPLLSGARVPLFDQADSWYLGTVVRTAANQPLAYQRITFTGLAPAWNLMAREMAMIWLNPRHPGVLAAGIHLRPEPRSISIVRLRVGYLRTLADFGTTHGLPDKLSEWRDQDLQAYVQDRRARTAPEGLCDHIVVIKAMHHFRKALTCGGLQADPWPGSYARTVLALGPVGGLRTPVIPPETWFPLVRAAWTYISEFGPDIVRAQDRWQQLRARAQRVDHAAADRLLEDFLANPDTRIPVGEAGPEGSAPDWDLTALMAGIDTRKAGTFFAPRSKPGARRRAAVGHLVAAGRIQSGLLPALAQITRPDGTPGPWHPCLDPGALGRERLALRGACYAFTAALSMMRDSEIREIVKGSVVEYYSTRAIRSTQHKGAPAQPVKHWWIIEPVAQAIETAARLSTHPDLAFGPVKPGSPNEVFSSSRAVNAFITHANHTRSATGLPEIPAHRITPHMFRRTMAMLTRDFPGSEIAVGMQLKHAATRALANRVTGHYMNSDPAWIGHLDTAIGERVAARLEELFDADTRGETIGYGPGAGQMRESFAAVRQAAEQLRTTGRAQRGDTRVEHDLLRRTRLSVRFGTLNHCVIDEGNPIGAKCLEDAVIPPGHRGPLLDRCQPGRCANSALAPEHLPMWQAERQSLTVLLATPSLPPARRAHLAAQLHEVDIVLGKADA